MAPNPFKISAPTLYAALAAVIAIELAVGWAFQWTPLSRYEKIGLLRLLQTAAVWGIVLRVEGAAAAMGWAPPTWPAGLRTGLVWSMGFAAAALLGMGVMHLLGYHPLGWIRVPLPPRPFDVIVLFLVGGVIAPIAEEIFFRGILYAYFRRWGIVCALVASTLIFVLLHFNRLPITQAVGGIVFALSYETSRNLMTPITIHALGNLALFTLSLPMFNS